MRHLSWLILSTLPLSLLPFAPAIACGGNGSSGTPPGAGSFVYSPLGCVYGYAVPASLGYTDMALDDGRAGDPSTGAPVRVRLGLGGGTEKGRPGYADPTTSTAFTWETASADRAARVQIGTDPNALADVHTGYVWRVPKGRLNTADLILHEVHVCGLEPGTTYFYRVGGGPAGAGVWSATQSFATVPSGGTITVGVFGDARDSADVWQAVHLRMRDAAVPLQIIGGDMVDVGALEALYAEWLDKIWHDPNDPAKFVTLGQQIMLPVAGNHENDSADFFANFALPGDGPYAETFASFDMGSAHVVLLDDQQIAESLASGSPNGAAAAQLSWLERDLGQADADRAKHPFVVVISHRGLFSTSEHAADADVLAARGALAPLFDRHAVDLVINGHEHEYERSQPLRAGNQPGGAPIVGSPGTTYVVCAGAGADAYPVGTKMAAYSAKRVPYGAGTSYVGTYALLAIAPQKLTLTAYGLKASSTTVAGDDVIDTVTLAAP
jgi:hypothetical protein